jgi:hypothetical protein
VTRTKGSDADGAEPQSHDQLECEKLSSDSAGYGERMPLPARWSAVWMVSHWKIAHHISDHRGHRPKRLDLCTAFVIGELRQFILFVNQRNFSSLRFGTVMLLEKCVTAAEPKRTVQRICSVQFGAL